MDPILETLLQTGALAVITYFLIQYQREQATAHREELKALLVQTAIGQDTQAREHREQLRRLVEDNSAALLRLTAEVNALENSVLALSHHTTNERNLTQLKEMLCPGQHPPLPRAPLLPSLKEEDYG